jgi:hypothetical protein
VALRSSIYQQSLAASFGGERDLNDDLRSRFGNAYQPGTIDFKSIKDTGIRLMAYYPPTRTYYDWDQNGDWPGLSNFLTSITWSDAVDQGAVAVSIELDASNDKIISNFNRPGMIFFLWTRGARGKYNEVLRCVAFETSISTERVVTITAFDHVYYLLLATGSFKYSADRKHKKGWTAHEIALDICRRYRIPVAARTEGEGRKKKRVYSLVRTKYRIKNFSMPAGTSVYDALAKVYSIDGKKTGKFYFIEADRGRIRIRRSRQQAHIFTVTAEEERRLSKGHIAGNLRNASLSRSIMEYGSVVFPTGSDRGNDGKPKPRSRDEREEKKKPKESKRERERRRRAERRQRARDNRERGRGEAPTPAPKDESRIAASTLFGHVPVSGPNGRSITDPAYSREQLQATADKLARAQKTLTLTADGNTLVRQGDQLFVRIPWTHNMTEYGQKRAGARYIFSKYLFVRSVTHTVTPGDYAMEIECAWREKEVDAEALNASSKEPRNREDDETGSQANYDKEELASLWKDAGGDPSWADRMADIAIRESGGKAAANNAGLNANGTVDHGLWQINDIWRNDKVIGPMWEQRYDGPTNAKMAVRVFKVQGPTAWATYGG